jgi:hypothetical protein
MSDDRPPIHVGDHVEDRDADDAAPALVVGRPGLSAKEYAIDDSGRTVADANREYDATDAVIEVAFCSRTAGSIPDRTYVYPIGRLEVVASIHEENTDE